MSVAVLAFVLGGVLLLTGILGGGFEVKELKIPKVGGGARVLSAATGIVFIVVGVVTADARPDPAPPGPQVNPSPTYASPITFTVEDQLGDRQISEKVEVIIDGQLKGTMSVNRDYRDAVLTVTVPHPGRYSYTIRAVAYFEGLDDEYVGTGQGMINVTAGKKFELEAGISGNTWLVSLTEKTS